MVTVYVGSGGKTTAIFTQAARLRAGGKRVLVTTTTHLQTPAALAAAGRTLPLFEERYLSLTSDSAEIAARLEADGFCIAALPAQEPGKLAPLPDAVYEAVCPLADAVLVEADGSRGLPLKAPASHEPVIPANADEIVVLCGLSALGKPLSQVTHRLPLALALLPGAGGGTLVDPGLLLKLVTAAYLEPLRRRFPGVPVRLLPGQADTLYRRCLAAMLSAGLDPAPLKECWFAPAPHLVLLGGGHVSLALYRIARVLDWRVTVLDDRPEFADPARFPEAEVIRADFTALEKDLPTSPGVWYAVLTHGHLWDKACVEAILRAAPRRGYLGMIGSRNKVRAVFTALREAGFSEEAIATVRAPIGLDLGGQTPAEIAVSIAAQLIQEGSAKGVSSLTDDLLALEQKPGLIGAFALILEKTGSAPRGPGSLLVLEPNGIRTGTVGGGSLELRVLEELSAMLSARSPAVIQTYDVSAAEGARLGMVCGGRVTLLLGLL